MKTLPTAAASLLLQVALPASDAVQNATPATPVGIEVNIEQGYAPAMIAAVAEVGQPQPVTIGKGQSLRSLIEARCGTVDPVYLAAFLKENRNEYPALTGEMLDGLLEGGEFRLPACLTPIITSYPVAQLDQIGSIFSTHAMPLDQKGLHAGYAATPQELPGVAFAKITGLVAGADPFVLSENNIGMVRTENARRFVRLNPGIDPYNLKPGVQILQLDTGRRTGTVIIRQGLSLEKARVLIEAARTSKPSGVLSAEMVNPARLDDDAPLSADECRDAEKDDNWPFSMAMLDSALKANETHRAASVRDPPLVLIADTGIDDLALEGTIAIPKSSLGLMPAPNGSVPDQVGINAARNQVGAHPPEGLASASHGFEVAATVLGGWRYEGKQASYPFPKVVFASLAQPVWPPYLAPGALATAYRHAAEKSIPIVNASVRAPAPYLGFRDGLKKQPLLITAAGNVKDEPQDFGQGVFTWPGGLGGEPKNAKLGLIISVGAHDNHGKLLTTSRKSARRVDLLAPGCRIPTWTARRSEDDSLIVEKVRRNGTSFAAPIVTMVASLLWREHLDVAAIKLRLLTTVDVDLDLEDAAWSMGRLNIGKALLVWRDRITYVPRKDPGAPAGDPEPAPVTLTGLLVTPMAKTTVCNRKLTNGQIRQLVRASSSTDSAVAQRWIGWASSEDSEDDTDLERLDCPVTTLPSGSDLAFIDDATGNRIDVPVTRIIDYTAAWKRPAKQGV